AQVMNLHSFDAENMDLEILSDSVQVIPMFAERVVVTVSGLNMDGMNKSQGDILRRILSDIPESTVVIISAGGEGLYRSKKALTAKNKSFADLCGKLGCVCEFNFRSVSEVGRSVVAALEKRGATISRRDAEYVAELCLCETAFISMEIEKLAAYANGGSLTREDIDALCIRRVDSDGYSLAVNILRGNAVFVFGRIDELKRQGYEPTPLLAIISSSLTDLYRAKLCRAAGMDYRQCAADFGYAKNREFVMKNAFSECGNIPLERLHKAVTMLADTEYKMKTRSMNTAAQYLAVEQYAAAVMA
ncbi:MAG: DNA polymerase III subunit delta, partial [Ruminococcus sp.]|nr:DNA polymerase III subunit delta [Ruminococcus sp.]